MVNIKSIISILFYISRVNSFLNQPAKISPVINYEFNFPINLDTKSEQIESNIHQKLNSITNEIKNEGIKSISKEIELTIGIENSQINHMTWEFVINTHISSLKIINIIATIDKYKVDMVIQQVKIEQYIPILYDIKEICENSGKRRYRFAGPRKKECRQYSIERGLTVQEIQIVQQTLINEIPRARFLMLK